MNLLRQLEEWLMEEYYGCPRLIWFVLWLAVVIASFITFGRVL